MGSKNWFIAVLFLGICEVSQENAIEVMDLYVHAFPGYAEDDLEDRYDETDEIMDLDGEAEEMEDPETSVFINKMEHPEMADLYEMDDSDDDPDEVDEFEDALDQMDFQDTQRPSRPRRRRFRPLRLRRKLFGRRVGTVRRVTRAPGRFRRPVRIFRPMRFRRPVRPGRPFRSRRPARFVRRIRFRRGRAPRPSLRPRGDGVIRGMSI